jgi:phosphoserine phosphatase
MKNKYDIICFDVDSTLVKCEGLDWLAEEKGVGEEVCHLTEQAMNGEVPMEEIFSKKLDILRPSKKDLDLLGEYYCSKLVEKSTDVLETLHKAGLDIYLVTGSFTPAILCLAEKLQIPEDHIHANEIYHDTFGEYRGINLNCSLTKSSGKKECATAIGNNKKIAFVGDSVTDLATQPVVTTFIGYGGVKVRKKVKENADFYIKSESLEPLLWLILD